MVTCTAILQKRDLWQQFHQFDTEMIITKAGRRMFPAMRVQVYQLDPLAKFCVLMEMVPVGKCRFKYSASSGWAPAGAEEAQSPHRVYLHPDSPASGEHWMSQPISFGRLKLTNTSAPPPGYLVLSSMHKYQPRMVIVKADNPAAMAWAPTTSIVFAETQFIAVTAYQNERITRLKIDHNPFAKGFRENGQSKYKRKRHNLEQESRTEDEINNNKSFPCSAIPTTTDVANDRLSGPPTPELVSGESISLNHSFPTHSLPTHPLPHPYPPNLQDYSLYSYYLSCYAYNAYMSMYPSNYQTMRPIESKPNETSRRFTDFSMGSIMSI